ncbi:MAG: DUF4332 domain-containing protein [Promethearchaeota archaeon]
MAEEIAITELTKIKGLNKKQAIKLYRAGIKSIKKLSSSNPEEISKITGIAKKQLTTWVILARAQERKKFIEVDVAAEEISQLLEIKIDDAKRLVSAGVMSIDDLAEESADLLSEDTGMAINTITNWIKKAKDIKKIPPEKRKVVFVPTAEISFGSKMSGAFFGSSSGFTNIYNDSSSFGQSFVFMLISSIFFCLYLSMSQATLGVWSLANLWETLYLNYGSMVFTIGTMQITFYPLVLIVGIILVLGLWLLFAKIIASNRNLEFKGTLAVLGFAMAPGILIAIVFIGKFIPVFHIVSIEIGGHTFYLLTIILLVFTLWVVIVFIRGLSFSPKGQTISTRTDMKTRSRTRIKETETVLEVVETGRKPTEAAKIEATSPARAGPLNLSEFGSLIDGASLTSLQNAGFNTSIDLLRASSKNIAERTSIQQSKIIIWRIISDLIRIPGIQLEAALILTKSGVRSVKHLSKINENALKVQVLDTISKENIATSITAKMISDWVKKAKYL